MSRRDDDQEEDRGARSRRSLTAKEREELREIPRRSGEASRVRRSREDEEDRGSRTRGESRRGFAAMDPEERREISRRGGDAMHERPRGPEWSEEEARGYGREGGRATHEPALAHEWSTREAREAGREGGRSRSASEEDEGEYCPECGRGGRMSREETGRRGALPRWGPREEEEELGRMPREEKGHRASEARFGREEEDEVRGGSRRGIPSWDEDEQREIVSRGGRYHPRGRSRED